MTLDRRSLPAVREAESGSAAFVPHLDLEAVQRLMAAASLASPGSGERDSLLIATMFDGCLRVSEVLALRPTDLKSSPSGWSAQTAGWLAKAGGWE